METGAGTGAVPAASSREPAPQGARPGDPAADDPASHGLAPDGLAPGAGGPGGPQPGELSLQLAPVPQPVAVLEDLLIARGERLLRAAVLLAGSHADGEDLLQAALERVYRHWGRIDGDPEGYLRRTLYHLAADGWRRKGALRARLGLIARPDAQPDETGSIDQRDQLIRLLRELPPRQRTAIVLRYWEELSEAEAARLMGCSTGYVKSAASRGMRKLRELNALDGAEAGSAQASSAQASGLQRNSAQTDSAPADGAPADSVQRNGTRADGTSSGQRTGRTS